MPVGNQTSNSVATEYLNLVFVIQQLMGGMATATIVRVVACTNDGDLSPAGTVDVLPLVNMLTGDSVAFGHEVLHGLPYSRLQGGDNAVIIDPKVNDLGIAVFASRDISAVVKSKSQANPGSARQFSMSDGMYIGGLLNGAPTQYVQFTDTGITIKSPSKITLEAPEIDLKGAVVQTGGDVTMSDNLTVQGTVEGVTDVIFDGISGKSHTHDVVGVQSGSDTKTTTEPHS